MNKFAIPEEGEEWENVNPKNKGGVPPQKKEN